MNQPMTLYTAERIFRSTTGNISASKIILTRKAALHCTRAAKTLSLTNRCEYQVVKFEGTGKRTVLRHFKRGVEVPV